MNIAEKISSPQPPALLKCRVPLKGEIPVRDLYLDNSKPCAVPGALSSHLSTNPKAGGRVRYKILYVTSLRAFQIDCLHPNNKLETVYLPEHIVILWVADEALPS